MNYKRKSQNQWQWQGRNKTYHVRIFPQQGTLIWGAWMQGGEGVVFDEGSKQTYAQFPSRWCATFTSKAFARWLDGRTS
jgi:hypothetical protein